MTRPRPLCLHVLGCAALALAAPASANAAWTPPQDLGLASSGSTDSLLASNARGDAVAVFSEGPGISVARASAGQPFGARSRISGIGDSPRVAIDERGVVLVAFEYNDETDLSGFEDRGGEACCVATKVVVWRPGHAPSRPRHVRRRGLGTSVGAVAAVRGRRGLLFVGGKTAPGSGSVQYVPVRLDGRPGRLRRVASSRWAPASLQFVGRRAVAGLIASGRRTTTLAVRRQRRAGTFGTLRAFRRIPEQLGYLPAYHGSRNEVSMTPDGRGGQVAVWRRGRRTGSQQYLQLARKPRDGRLRTVTIRKGPARELLLSAPAVSPDGWVALPFTRNTLGAVNSSEAYVVALRPDGEAVVTSLGAGTSLDLAVVSVTSGGAGAVGGLSLVATPSSRLTNFVTVTSFIPLEAGVPQPSRALLSRSNDFTYATVRVTSNPRDRARALWEDNDRRRMLASRLE